nr:hypothetical protein GCM10020092_005040 [Actinoplanes digitatis]
MRAHTEIGEDLDVADRVGVGVGGRTVVLVVVRGGPGRRQVVQLERGRLDVGEQQRTEPRLVGVRRVGAEHAQVLALIEAQNHQVLIVGLDEEQRQLCVRLGVAKPVHDLVQIGKAGELQLRRRPPVLAPNDGGSEKSTRIPHGTVVLSA